MHVFISPIPKLLSQIVRSSKGAVIEAWELTLCSQAATEFKSNTHSLEIIRHIPIPFPQDTISHLKQKMAANTRENNEKMSTIKEASKLILTKNFSQAPEMRVVSWVVLLQDREAVLAHFRELKAEMTVSRDLERFALVLPPNVNATKEC